MIFEEDSRICFCIDFTLKEQKSFFDKLYEIMKEDEEDLLDIDSFKIPLEIGRSVPFNLMQKKTSINIKDFETRKKEIMKLITIYSKKLEKITDDKKKQRLQKDINFLEDSLMDYQKPLTKTEGNFRIELRTLNPTPDTHIKNTFNIIPEMNILELIKKSSENHFLLNICCFLYLDKKKYSFKHGFKLGQKIVLSKEVSEKIGIVEMSGITLKLNDNPIGIEKLDFGVDERRLKLDMELELELDSISNIMEKINILFDIIKLFLKEV